MAEPAVARLSVFDEDDSLSGRRIFAELPEGAVPDGICLDAEGAVWMASDEGGAMDAHAVEVFFDVQSELPRQGPGDPGSTRAALRACVDLVEEPRVLDVGCGPGAQTIVLAETLPDAIVTAIDLHQPYLDELRKRALSAGLQGRIRTLKEDMRSLPFEDESFDLIWAEGSAYIMGVENALIAWRPLLRPGGYLALTELVWLADDPPPQAAAFFERAYPAMTTSSGVLSKLHAAGYDPQQNFSLPDSAWWDDYYTPLANRLPGLEEKYASDEVAMSVIEMVRAEISLREKFGESYGYEFFVARKPQRS